MLLTVWVPRWELEEDGRVLGVGDEVRVWLTFQEVERWAPRAEQINLIQAVAVPLPIWSGAEFGRHPVQLNLAGGAVYWDAPAPIAGLVEVAGSVGTNTVDAPDGFPTTTGVLRRLRMMWQDVVMSPSGGWRSSSEGTRYEQVNTTYFPVPVTERRDPAVEAGLMRRARAAYNRAVAAGRLNPGDSFGLFQDPRAGRHIPSGTTQTRWTGVLIDLEIADAINE